MSEKPTRETAAGRAYLDLRKLAVEQGRPTAELQQLYALEGLLARLPGSEHSRRFVLKGGVLLAAFDARRPTKDIDLAASGLPNNPESVRGAIAAVLQVETGDGLTFDVREMTAETIRKGDAYSGVRVSVPCQLSTAVVDFHVDVNVGDPIVPAPETLEIPRLLGGEPIRVLGYPVTMVLAEKIVTALERGAANTRWRDFADIVTLTEKHSVSAPALQRSLRAVADHRGIDTAPLSDGMEGLAEHGRVQWSAWRRRTRQTALPEDLADVLGRICAFADPLLRADRVSGTWNPAASTWE